MELKAFHLSAQGFNHIRRGKPCQDASKSYSDENCAIAVVCDGHGGEDYVRSGTGAQFACEVAVKNLKQFVTTISLDEFQENTDKVLERLAASIISGWCGTVYTHFRDNPFTEEELSALSEKARKQYTREGALEGRIEKAYGTTLLAAIVTREYYLGLQIGDGKWVAVDRDGRFGQPVPWDEKCFLNATTSICDADALANFRHFPSGEDLPEDFPPMRLPAAIFVGSDGIDDCFIEDAQLYHLYETVICSFGTSEFKEAEKELEDYLPRLSQKGSGDDVSIAGILDMDAVAELKMVGNFKKKDKKDQRNSPGSVLLDCTE